MKSIFLLFASIAAKNRANLPYYDVIDGIRCKKSDWDSKAVARPFLETHSGSVKGKHNCKVCWIRIAELRFKKRGRVWCGGARETREPIE